MEASDIYATAIRRAKLAGQTPSVVQFVVPTQKPVEGPKQATKPDELSVLRKWIASLDERLAGVIHSVEEIMLLQRPIEPIPDDQPTAEPILRRPRVVDIKQAVASHYGFGLAEIEGASRKAEVVQARQIAQHLCRRLTLHSMPSIGLHFGGRDHTTVLHADRIVRERRKKDEAFDTEMRLLESKIIERMR